MSKPAESVVVKRAANGYVLEITLPEESVGYATFPEMDEICICSTFDYAIEKLRDYFKEQKDETA